VAKTKTISIGAAMTIIIAIVAMLYPSRPLVDFAIQDLYRGTPPETIDFKNGPIRFFFAVRNRGASDALVSVDIAIVGGFLSSVPEGPFNTTNQKYVSRLNAHSNEYGGWMYYVTPVKDSPKLQIVFSVAKLFELSGSGLANFIWGEYNAWNTNLIYVRTAPNIYKLQK
jgi:hypothetical protein